MKDFFVIAHFEGDEPQLIRTFADDAEIAGAKVMAKMTETNAEQEVYLDSVHEFCEIAIV